MFRAHLSEEENRLMAKHIVLKIVILTVAMATSGLVVADDQSAFVLEMEAGSTWQTSNDVQVPNTLEGTRFSLKDFAGKGPWLTGRIYFTWNISPRNGVRLLLAPFSYTETGIFDEPVGFAGASYLPEIPTEATYQFNSWRLTYRYKLKDGDRWKLWVGGSLKVRDAKIELRQGDTTSKDTDLGLVPLVYFAADYRLAQRWRVLFDFDGLAGGPGRAIDLSLKLRYDVNVHWAVTAGYRMLEGGVDIDDVYNFAWFNSAVVSGIYRF
jgi:hypothetical protein